MAEEVGTLMLRIIADVTSANKGIDALSDKVESLSSAEKKGTSKTKEYKKQTDELGKSAKNAGKNTDSHKKSVDGDTEALKKNSNEQAKSETAFGSLSGKIQKAKNEFDKFEKPVKNISQMLGPMNSILGAMGITAGISELISAFKDMADKAREARDNYTKLQETISYQTGNLSENQSQRVNKIASKSQDSIGFADVDMVSSAVFAVDKLYSNLDESVRDKLTMTFLGVSEVIGEDVTQIIQDVSRVANLYEIPSDKVGELADNMRKLQQATGTNVSDIANLMYDYQDVFQTLGVDTPDAIASVASQLVQVNKGDISAVEKYLTDFQNGYESAYSTALQDAKNQALKTYDKKNSDITEEEFLAPQMKNIEKDAQAVAEAYAKTYQQYLAQYLTTDTGNIMELFPLIEGGRSNEVKQQVRDTTSTLKNQNDVEELKKRMQNGEKVSLFEANIFDTGAIWSDMLGDTYDQMKAAGAEDGEIFAAQFQQGAEGILSGLGDIFSLTIPGMLNNGINGVQDAFFNLWDDSADELNPVIENTTLLSESFDNVGNSLGIIQQNTETYNTTTVDTTVPYLSAEKTAVDNLTTSYWNLAAAKDAAGDA